MFEYSQSPGAVGVELARSVFQPEISKSDNSVGICWIIIKLLPFVVPMGAIRDKSLVDIRPKLYVLGSRVCGF